MWLISPRLMAKIQSFSDVARFVALAEPFLLRDELLNNVPLRIVGGLKAGSAQPQPGMFLGVCLDDAGQVLGVALRTPPFQIVFSVPCADEAIVAFAAAVPAPLPAVMSRVEIAEAFAAAWQRRHGISLRPGTQMRVYQLNRVHPPAAVPGELSPLPPTEHALVRRWLEAFHKEVHPHDPMRGFDLTDLLVWRAHGETVSMVRARPSSAGVGVVNDVYTPPAHRGRGYASAAVAAASAGMLAQGFPRCALFTDLANPISNRIYQRVGYTPAADFRQILFEQPS